MADPERWTLPHGGHVHVLQVEPAGWGRRLVWTRDGDLVADRTAGDDRVDLTPGEDGPADAGALTARFGWWGPARRVTLFQAEGDLDAAARALVGVGGVDLQPEPGSPAARRQAWVAAHPRLHTARRTLAAAAAVLVPLLLGSLALRLPWPGWDLPTIPWPSIPWPDIPWPSIPWPSIPWPSIPWPSIPWPDVSLPGWLEEVLSYARYVVPVAVAFVLARREVRRHRDQQRSAGSRPDGDAPRRGTVAPGTGPGYGRGMSDTADVVVTEAPERSRYEARVGGELAGWSEYTPTEEMLVFTHTEVQPSFEGRGVGSALTRYALDDVRCRGMRALAVCPFVLGWIQRHPAYADLEYRSRTRPGID